RTRERDEALLALNGVTAELARAVAEVEARDGEVIAMTVELRAARERVQQLEDALEVHGSARRQSLHDLDRARIDLPRGEGVVVAEVADLSDVRREVEDALIAAARLEAALASQIEERSGELDDTLAKLEDSQLELAGVEDALAGEQAAHEASQAQRDLAR